jgi:hypothetical protein
MQPGPDEQESVLIRPLAAVLALAAGFGLAGAIATGSSTEVGQTTDTPTFGVQTPVVPASTVPGTPSYETPSGVLTSWRFHSSGDAAAGAVRLKIFRYTGSGLVYKVLAESSVKTLAPNTGYEFQERIPVAQGDLLGLTAIDDAEVAITVPNTPGNQMAQFGGGDIPVGQTGTATIAWPNLRPSVAATVESDLDKDGFGDESQDKCPVDSKTQGLCKVGVGKLKRNTENGTAIIPVTVPGAGTLSLSGKGVVKQRDSVAYRTTRVSKAVTGAGVVKLLVKAKGKKKRNLNRNGQVKVKTVLKYTPIDGPPVSQPRRVKLVKKQ